MVVQFNLLPGEESPLQNPLLIVLWVDISKW